MLQNSLLSLNWYLLVDWLRVEVRINLLQREELIPLFAFRNESSTICRLKIYHKYKKVFLFIVFLFRLMNVWSIVLLDEELSFCCERRWLSLSSLYQSQAQHQDRAFTHNSLSTRWLNCCETNDNKDKVAIDDDRRNKD